MNHRSRAMYGTGALILVFATLVCGCGASVRQARLGTPGANSLLQSKSLAIPSGPASAERWQKVDSLAPGSCCLVVTLQDGSKVRGRFEEAEPQTLILETPEGETLRIPKDDVHKVVHKQSDGAGNGTLIGLAAGLGAGLGLGYAASESLDVATRVTLPTVGGLGAGVGALVDYLIDRSRSRKEILFEAQ